MVENACGAWPRSQSPRPRLEVIRDAAVEVRRPTLFGELIIMIVYLPILTLEGVEGKLFRPDGPDRDLRPGRLAGPLADADAALRLLLSYGLPRRMQGEKTLVDPGACGDLRAGAGAAIPLDDAHAGDSA